MKGFTRFVQQTRELTASKDDRTEIPADVQSLLLKAEGVETLYAGVVDASIAFFPSTDTVKTKHADDPTRAQPLFKFGTGLEMMGGEYGSDRSARAFFDAAHGAMAVLATEKAMLDEAATAHYLDPKREICKETIKSAKAHYEKLKARRLELDAAKHKLKVEKKSGGEDAGKLRKLELGVEAATARFDQEVEAVRSLLAPLMDDEQMRVEACRAAAVTLRAMRDYFRRSLEVMEAFDGKVDLEHWAATGGAHGGPAVARGPSTTFLRQSSSMPVSNETPTSARNSYAQEQQHAKSPAPPVPVHRVAEQHPGVVPNRQQAGVASTQLPPPTSAKPVVGSAIAQRQAMLQQQLAQAAVSVATQQHRSSPVPASREVAPATPADCYRALYVFQAQQPGDLAMERGDVVEITGRKGDWWQARNVRTGETGSVPANYLERV